MFGTLVLVGIGFGILYKFVVYQKDTQQQMQDAGQKNVESNYMTIILSTGVSVIINILNFVYLAACKVFTEWERQQTITEFNTQTIKKLSIAQFLITSISIFVIEIFLQSGDQFYKMFGSNALVYNVNQVIIGNTFIPFFVEAFDIGGKLKRLERWLEVDYQKKLGRPIRK